MSTTIRTAKHVTVIEAHPFHRYVLDERDRGGHAVVEIATDENCPLCRKTIIQAEIQRRMKKALDHIQAAQNELGRAQAELSAIQHGAPECAAVGREYDRVRRLWYRVEKKTKYSKLGLDEMGVKSLQKRLLQSDQD